MAAKISTKPSADCELIKARAREQVASRKLDRLKDRYEKLKSITDTEFEKQTGEREALALRNEELEARCRGLQDEASMWRTQLFEQLDRLDSTKEEFYALQAELAQAQWELVELVDLERTRCETALALSQAEVHQLSKELVSARARVDGLKNLGSCLAAKLDRATAQRKVLQREHARLTELAEMRAGLLESRDEEIATLRAELFEARGQLLSHQLDSPRWETLREGLGEDSAEETVEDLPLVLEPTFPEAASKPVGQRRLKLAFLPAEESRVEPLPKRLWMRAGKTFEGWFKLK